MSLTQEQTELAIAALLPRYEAIQELLDNPVMQLPNGIVDWEEAKKQCSLHRLTLIELQNMWAASREEGQ
jgi:hypothetical protein